MHRSLVVVAADDDLHRDLAATTVGILGAGGHVDVLDLHAIEFTPAMSRSERTAYHSAEPLIDEQTRAHAGIVTRASTLAFVFPTETWGVPPILKAWFERVLVPGVGFVFDERNRVRPNLTGLETIAGVTTHSLSARERRIGGDGARHIVTRALRLNAPKARTLWISDDRAKAATLHARIGQMLG